MKKIAERIFRQTLAAIDVPGAIEKKLGRSGSRIRAGEHSIDLREFHSIVAIAYGKASLAMADGLMRVLSPDFSLEGILVVPATPARQLSGWQIFVGGHPVPNAGEFRSGARHSASAGALRRTHPDLFSNFWRRLVSCGAAARPGSHARGFRPSAFGAGQMRRIDRGNQRHSQARIRDKRRAPGRGGAEVHENHAGDQRRTGRTGIGVGLGANSAGPFDDSRCGRKSRKNIH